MICTTGLAAQSRDQVERMAVMHGAQYDPNLEVGYTSVLIAQRPGGAKYDACVNHGIPVVHISWLHACVENQTLLDESEFALEKILRPSRLFSQLQEEVQQVMTALPQLLRRYRRQRQEDEERSPGSDDDGSDEEIEWMELFDSCIFHLVGFPAKMEASLQQLIRTSMGTIYYELSTSHVTHVLVSPSLRDLNVLVRLEEQVAMDSADGHIHFVSTKWLLDSVKCLRIEPEELYPVEVDTEHELPQPPPISFAAPVYTPSAADTTVDASFDQLPDVEDDYQDSHNSTEQHDEPGATVVAGEHDLYSKSNHTQRLFSGCAFLLLSRDPDDHHLIKPMVKQIQKQSSAQAIALNFQDLAHLDLSQFTFITHIVICNGVDLDADVAMQVEQQLSSLKDDDGANDHSTITANPRRRHRRVTFVSDLWVNCCLAAQVKLSHQAHELFSLTVHQTRSMFSRPLPLACFHKVRASTSVYVGVDRLVVMELLRLAGAQATSKMSKRNTHLICLKPIGMKYEKAKEWGLTIVTARWLIQSMVQGALLDANAEEFQVRDDAAGNGGEAGEHNGDVEMGNSQQDYEE